MERKGGRDRNMIDRRYGKWFLTCENCNTEEEFDTFDEAVQYARDEGWQIRKLDGEWTHICEGCREDGEDG